LYAAKRAGFDNILVDTAVIDMPGVILAAEAVYWIKKELGLPAGAAPTNAIDNWSRRREFALGSTVSYSGISIIAQTLGADFVFYGAIERAPMIFPACAMTDALIAYRARTLDSTRTKSREHPLYKIF
jgi:tetrahydromethanopterin S-methyltransferase subunit H